MALFRLYKWAAYLYNYGHAKNNYRSAVIVLDSAKEFDVIDCLMGCNARYVNIVSYNKAVAFIKHANGDISFIEAKKIYHNFSANNRYPFKNVKLRDREGLIVPLVHENGTWHVSANIHKLGAGDTTKLLFNAVFNISLDKRTSLISEDSQTTLDGLPAKAVIFLNPNTHTIILLAINDHEVGFFIQR